MSPPIKPQYPDRERGPYLRAGSKAGQKRITNGCNECFTGCNYTEEERQFIVAMDRYKRTKRRPFPTWREVLDVILALGYRRPDFPDPPRIA